MTRITFSREDNNMIKVDGGYVVISTLPVFKGYIGYVLWKGDVYYLAFYGNFKGTTIYPEYGDCKIILYSSFQFGDIIKFDLGEKNVQGKELVSLDVEAEYFEGKHVPKINSGKLNIINCKWK